jgi:SAM-dependent methyltransferase
MTAISRKKPSAPLRYLISKDLIKFSVLDYGCGRGMDGRFLSNIGYTEYYDPCWNPIDISGKSFSTILCTYVLNVLPKLDEQNLIRKIRSFLNDDGIAYITVRRDIKKDKITTKGLQRNVILDLEIIKEDSNFCIYKLKKI